MSLRCVPLEERPRERLEKLGAESLSSTELLAILLSTGTKGKSVLALAGEMLGRFGSLEGLFDASLEELMQVKGVGRAKAIQLGAAFALAKRGMGEALEKRVVIGNEEAVSLVKEALLREKREVLIVILKDVKERLIAWEKIGVGTVSHVLIHPREVFYPAVRRNASSFILVHNHPSGDHTPSREDVEVTRLLMKSSQVMGIKLDDHLVVGREGFTSLRSYLESDRQSPR